MKSNPAAGSPRTKAGQWTLKPQDLVVALKLVCLRGERLTYVELGNRLFLSQGEAHAASRRLVAARLAGDVEGQVRPIISTLQGFIQHGAPYCFPPVRGEMTIGVPTAHGASPLRERVLFADENPPVWPHPEGKVRGIALQPLYEKAPYAALEDRALYELLALFDALRIGQKREQGMAADLINERLG